jgi:hypothetical protein
MVRAVVRRGDAEHGLVLRPGGRFVLNYLNADQRLSEEGRYVVKEIELGFRVDAT